ncbi:MAG: hypothetical protein EA376_05355 [Phycisphaeraceae bacterium]|nr:MAG: hypothetical protein EA376_05355 [Phycisphaeraceae bacterium]
MVALVAVFLVAAWAGWFASMRVGGEPVQRFDAVERLNELAASWQPEGANAWPVYERLSEWHRLGQLNDLPDWEELLTLDMWLTWRDLSQYGFPRSGAWDDPLWDHRRTMVEMLVPVLRLLDVAADAPRMHIHHQSPTLDEVLRDDNFYYFTLRNIAMLNASAMRAAAEAGDWDEHLQRFRTGVAMARHLSLRPLIIDHMVSIAIGVQAHRELQQQLMELEFPAEVCEKLLQTLTELRWPAGDPAALFDGERIWREDWIQRAFSDDGRGGGHFLAWTMPPWTPMNTPFEDLSAPPLRRLLALSPDALRTPSRKHTERAIELEFTTLERVMRGEVGDQEAINIIDGAKRPFMHLDEDFSETLLPAAEQHRLYLTIQATTEAMLRMALHKARTGAWPRTLNEAMSEAEALEPVSGEPFRYVYAPQVDEHERPFLLMAPDAYPFRSTLREWPVLNQSRFPISDWMRREEELRREQMEEE